MKLFVIEGGKGDAVLPERTPFLPTAADVDAEARRRIRRIGYETWRVRESATGVPMPKAIKYLQMQIAFAADALVRLDRIPDDFRADLYWPVG